MHVTLSLFQERCHSPTSNSRRKREIVEELRQRAIPAAMAFSRSISHFLCGLLLFITAAESLKFDLQAYHHHEKKSERCIRNFVSKDTLVVVTATIGGSKGDGMTVNMHVSSVSRTIGKPTDQMRYRLKMLLETSMASLKMSSARKGWLSHPMRMPHLMSVLRISSLAEV